MIRNSDIHRLRGLFAKRLIATMDMLKKTVGTVADLTVFRKLRELDYCTSYSHRGRFYTLRELAEFDENGLWWIRSVGFSSRGTLVATAEGLVNASEAGYAVEELDAIVRVGTKDVLPKLAWEKRLRRTRIRNRNVYFSPKRSIREQQIASRRVWEAQPSVSKSIAAQDVLPDELKAAIIFFFSLLDERERRVYAGLESLKLGYGGDRQMAEILGLDVSTVARGRRELLEHDVNVERVRKAGAGRKAVEKKTPEVIAAIEELMKYEVAGDPVSGLRWTRKTTKKIAAELSALGIRVSRKTVAKLLKQMNFSLRTNKKKISNGSPPTRDAQFANITQLRERFSRRGNPILSVDTKKKELVGRFKNPGRVWAQKSDAVNDHDFRSMADGVAIPYGIYDLQSNRGTVYVGTSYDTSQFAVECIEKWWRSEGQKRFPGRKHLLVVADTGGSNGATRRAWKHGIQHKLCNEHGLDVTVAHYPPGASKWNPIEHRLFSEISKNWAGRPLDSYETILNFIRTTKTKTGLKVNARLVKKQYPKGIKISDPAMALLNIKKSSSLPKWNYTLRPSKNGK